MTGQQYHPKFLLGLAFAQVLLAQKPPHLSVDEYFDHLRESLPEDRARAPEPRHGRQYLRSLLSTAEEKLLALQAEVETLKAEKEQRECNATRKRANKTAAEKSWCARLREMERWGEIVKEGSGGISKLVEGGKVLRVANGGAKLCYGVEAMGLGVEEMLGSLLKREKDNRADKVLKVVEVVWERALEGYEAICKLQSPDTEKHIVVYAFGVVKIFKHLYYHIHEISKQIIQNAQASANSPSPSKVTDIRLGITSIFALTISRLRLDNVYEKRLFEGILLHLFESTAEFIYLPDAIEEAAAVKETGWYYAHILRAALATSGEDGSKNALAERSRDALLEKIHSHIMCKGLSTARELNEYLVHELERMLGFDALIYGYEDSTKESE